MKSNIIIFFCLLIILSYISCKTPAKKQEAANPFLTATNGIELESRFLTADSLVFVFYKDPYGDDSLRYTRYYTQMSTTDSNYIKLLLQNFAKPFEKFEKVKKCRSEGKIWCYSKGKIFQTVSFATRCNDCCFVYFIKDGYFFYTALDTALANSLSFIKPLAKNLEAPKK
jgi:hypothetical protein